MAKVCHELGNCLFQIRLEAIVLLDNCSHEVNTAFVVKLVIEQMGKVNKHSDLLLVLQLLSLKRVIADSSVSLSKLLVSRTLNVSVIVGIFSG